MKIGFDVSDLCTNRADGTTRYTFELAKRLPLLSSQDNWFYFAPCDPYPSLREVLPLSKGEKTEGVDWISSPWPKYWTQSRLPFDLYRYQPDVMFMPIQQIPFIRPKKMKTVAVVHDVAFQYYPRETAYKDWMLQQLFTAYMVRNANQVIAVSQATAEDVAKYYGRTEAVSVVHHGVNHEVFKPVSTPSEVPGPYILYVGQIQPRKNLVRLVQAFEMVAQEDKDLKLVIAGSHGWLQSSIYRYIEHSPMKDRIIQLGRVSDTQLPVLYSNAEAFVLPSLYEGFGMPILEAMACECPVVTSNVSSMPEVARLRQGYGGQAEYAAVLVDPLSVDAIAAGVQEARRRKNELRESGVARAKEFTWERTTRETWEVLRSVY